MRLINQYKLIFKRPTNTVVNINHQKLPTDYIDIEAKGSLEPMTLGERTKVLPEGLHTTDTKIFYTSTKLQAADSDNDKFPDEVEINNKKYIVYDVGDWSTNNSRLAHHKVILVRKAS